MSEKKKQRKRSLLDIIISSSKAIYYAITEPIKLKIARSKNEKNYLKKEKNPLISVYCPTYNRGKLLMKRAVKSVLSQTYKNFEFIIVGDCCTDDTAKLVSKINDKRVKFYNLKKRGYRFPETAENLWLAGPVVAANKALEIIRGKWIARIDDDDIWTEDHLQTLLDCAQKGNYEFVSSLYEEKRHGKKTVIDGERANGPYYTRKNKPTRGYDPKIGGTQTWLYRSYLKLFRYNIDCWRKNWNKVNDTDISIRMFKAGVKMGFVDEVLGFYYPRPGEDTVGLDAYKEAEEKGDKKYVILKTSNGSEGKKMKTNEYSDYKRFDTYQKIIQKKIKEKGQ